MTYSRADRSASIYLDLAASVIKLMFSGIRAFRASDFGLQNVVSRALLSTSHRFSTNEIRDYVQWAHSQHDYKASLVDQNVAEIDAAISRDELVLFVIEPSVGAEIVVLCEKIQVVGKKKTGPASHPAAPVGGTAQ